MAQRCLKRLVELGLVEGRGKKGGRRYHLTSKGDNLLRKRDRVGAKRGKKASKVEKKSPEVKKKNNNRHEDGLMSLVGSFMASGLPVASGRRSWEHMGRQGGLSPDAMVLLGQGPYGPGWHYVEYERTGESRGRVTDKLKGYAATARQDDWPVLVACKSDKAEAMFHQLGKEQGLSMLTTTLWPAQKAWAPGQPRMLVQVRRGGDHRLNSRGADSPRLRSPSPGRSWPSTGPRRSLRIGRPTAREFAGAGDHPVCCRALVSRCNRPRPALNPAAVLLRSTGNWRVVRRPRRKTRTPNRADLRNRSRSCAPRNPTKF